VLDEIGELHRLPYSMDQQDLAYKGKARECYLEFVDFVNSFLGRKGQLCYERYQYSYRAFANLFLYGAINLDELLGHDRRRTYQATLLNWAVRDGKKGRSIFPILGIADDNHRNGTQSFVYSFVLPASVRFGYGLTTTEIHEYGHHLNLSHPADGFDYETKTDFFADGKFYFAMVGHEINSTMSYIELNWDFSQFDRDNTNRFQAAGYINNANALAKRILSSPKAERAQSELKAADGYYGQAKAALAAHDYGGTFDNAKRTYEAVLDGARSAGVKVEASNDGRTAVTATERFTSLIPGEYIDRPEPSDESPDRKAYTPLGHRMRR
jgi:hypothetical protein